MKKFYFFILGVVATTAMHAQAPAIEWQKTLGSTADDYVQINSIKQNHLMVSMIFGC